MKKVILLVVLIIVVGLIAFRIIQRFMPKKEKITVEIPTEVVVQNVTRGNIAKTISFTGNISGKEQVNVHPIEETGRLIKYLVKEGDRVSKGAVIALVDRSIKGLEFQPARITSPISGVVGMLFLDPGAMVSPQISVAMIANMDAVKVEIAVVEKDISHIKKGQKAKIRVDAYPDEIFTGILEELSPVINPMSRTAKCEIHIKNPGHRLRPGMYAKVSLIIDEHKDVIVVPQKAVLERNGEKLVFLSEGDSLARERKVEIGFDDEEKFEIVSGLKEGEAIIVLGNYGLIDGAKIVSSKK